MSDEKLTASELIEILQKYPPDVQVCIKINEETIETSFDIIRSINNVYPYVFEKEKAICICFERLDGET